MRNKTFTRVLCLALALLLLVSGAVSVVAADEVVKHDNLTDKTIADYKETLDLISYAEYQNLYYATAQKAEKEVTLLLTENWQFVNNNVIITMTDGVWLMKVVGDKSYASEEDAKEADDSATYLKVKEGDYRKVTATYNTLDEATAAGYNAADLAYVPQEGYDGVKAVYTPGRGSITWNINLSECGISAKTLFSLGLDYYPIVARSTPIEREFFINDKPVFSEAYVLSFSKVWGMFAQGSSTDAGGTLTDLSAKYTLSKNETIEGLVAAATAAGYEAKGGSGNAPVYEVSSDRSYITFYQPSYVTPKLSAFIQEYGLRFFPVDFNSNEIRPTQLQAPEWRRYIISDSDGYTHSYELTVDGQTTTYDSEYFGFVLDGKFTMTLESVNEPMALSTLTLLPYKAADSYEVYRQKVEALVGNAQGKDVIKLEAENPTATSSNVVYPVEDRASALTSPVDPSVQLLNTVGGEKWATAGQWVEYSFSVDSSGWYDIYTRFKQSYLDGMFTSRALTVTTNYGNDEEAYKAAIGNTAGYYNGLPFSEASGLRYDYSSDWQVTKLTSVGRLDENDTYQLYFEAGVVYTINLKVTFGTMSATVREIERILNALNDAYLSIVQYTGPTPDAYRDYNFYRMLPDTLDTMFAEKEAIANLSKFLREGAGVSSTYTGTCDKLVDLIGKMVVRGGEGVASGLSNFKAYSGGIGTFLGDVKTQPLQIDYLMIQPATAEAPKATPNFFEAFVHEIKSFFWTFFRDYNSMGTAEDYDNDDSVVVVWLPSGRDQANVVRNMTVNGFTQKNGIAVNLKLVNGGTLLPSILAGMGPDVYHGLGDDTVINYAIRGALISIEEFAEKYKYDKDGSVKETYVDWETICGQFNESAMLVFGVPDADDEWHYYGLPESQSFSMMFLRLDILNEIGIEIPQTWDDLYKAQSKLQNHNMEIGVGADYFPFLYQSGGSIWADEGMRINLDSEVALSAFNKMCNMFTQYSFPYDYSGANRFRTGEMPILISGYTGLYNQLKVFATELDGCWTFVPMPGTMREDGTIDNHILAGSSAVVMVSGAKHEEDAWDYMKWYTGAEAQATYANEMVAIMGESAKHATANREALASMPWTADEYVEVKKQFDNLLAIENYPGFYYVGRHTSFAFLAAYNDDKDPTTEILRYVNTINAEITRKRQEFNLETVELGSTLAEKRSNQIREALGVLEDRGLINRDSELYDQAMYGIVNQKVDILKIAHEMFKAEYLSKYDGSEKTITKVSGKTTVVPSYFVNVNKQTLPEARDGSGGYEIDKLTDMELLYFISEALLDTANAYASYRTTTKS